MQLTAKEVFFPGTICFVSQKAVVSHSDCLEGQRCLKAVGFIKKDDYVFVHTGPVLSERTWLTVQVSADGHIEVGDFGRHTNHSCEPNGKIRTWVNEDDTATVALIAIRDISSGEEITFDYATTEDEISPALRQIPCQCGSSGCRGRVFGFQELSEMEKRRLRKHGLLADHIK